MKLFVDFGAVGDYIRKYDYIRPNTGATVYTIIIWIPEDVGGRWWDMFFIGGWREQKRDEIFDCLCRGVHSHGTIYYVGSISNQPDSPNMMDARIGWEYV